MKTIKFGKISGYKINIEKSTKRENGYMYMYGWVPSLFTRNYHIVNQLYAYTKCFRS